MRKKILFILSLILFVQLPCIDTIKTKDLINLTFEELLQTEIYSANLTGIQKERLPFSVTFISKEQIQQTPARNLYDLIEIYVPGAIYVTHYRGQRLGIRGLLSDQNYSYQLLLNGKNINLKAIHGTVFEIQNKDLTDIERIEIVRGGGSVTYGLGATAGIINIITAEPKQDQYEYLYENNIQYRYNHHAFSISQANPIYSFILSGSICRSEGLENTQFWYIDRAQNFADHQPWGWGFMNSDWGNYEKGSLVPAFYNDYLETPEIKLDLALSAWENWKIWLRYSTTNHTNMQQASKSSEGTAFQEDLAKLFLAELSYEKKLSEAIRFSSTFGFDSASLRNYALWQGESLPFDHSAQLGYSFSENEWNTKSVLNFNLNSSHRFAIGFEYAYEFYAPEWGREDDTFLMSFQAPIRFAVLDSTSGFYQFYNQYGFVTTFDETIDGSYYSLFAEANLSFHPLAQLLLSIRDDKHQFAKHAFSPRVALISEWNGQNNFRLNWQRSVRLPPFTDIYTQDYAGNPLTEPETLQGFELLFHRQQSENLSFQLSSYLNQVEQIGWIDENENSDVLGTLELVGIEYETTFSYRNLSLLANYSFVKQLGWEPKTEFLSWLEGANGETIYLQDSGENRINNVPRHAIKVIANQKIDDHLNVHWNGRIMWDYQQRSMVDEFLKAQYDYGNSETLNEMLDIYQALEDHGYMKPSFTCNAAINWQMQNDQFQINWQLYAMNLLSINHIRYIIQYWEPGNVRMYPRQCGFVKEPIAVGMNINLRW